MSITTETNMDYLIPTIRLELGDIDSTSYRYLDEWIRPAMLGAIKALERRWYSRYTVGTDNDVDRDVNATYNAEAPPIIDGRDERAVVLQTCIILLSGTLENFSWDLGHWRDNEIAFSNVAGGGAKKDSLKDKMSELNEILLPPAKRLKGSKKGHLPGFKNNRFEVLPSSNDQRS